MIDVDIQILRVLSDTATSIFLNKKSNVARINSIDILDSEKKRLTENIIEPLDSAIQYLQRDIYNILIGIPVYSYFLSNQEGVNLFDSAQLISIIVDIDNFDNFGNLLSYSGFTPNSRYYNKKLHKLLLKIGYKLIKNNQKYNSIYESAVERYRKKYPKYTDDHIHNMAKRIVIKRFLKNLYISWKAIDKNF